MARALAPERLRMGKATESVEVAASLAETWDFYFEPSAWASWVDGFKAVERGSGYPEETGTLRWRSRPAGRGVVEERVLAHEPRSLHRIAFEDDYSAGELEVRFEIAGQKTKVTQSLEYKMKQHGAFGPLTDRLFVRRQVRRSLTHSLSRFRREVEEVAESIALPDSRPRR
jgi:hypothetical protein